MNKIDLLDPVPLYKGDVEEDLKIVGRNHCAQRITGGLSWPSKLPFPAWGTPAENCNVGSQMFDVRGSVCSLCYARDGHFRFDNVQNKLRRNLEGILDPLWTPAMAFLINYSTKDTFRWFHSGDITTANHLRNIITVAEYTREIMHWLPTREYQVVKQIAEEQEIPENLIIRISAQMIDGKPPDWWPTTSTVSVSKASVPSFTCPAKDQDNECKDCRACSNPSVQNIDYPLHTVAFRRKQR